MEKLPFRSRFPKNGGKDGNKTDEVTEQTVLTRRSGGRAAARTTLPCGAGDCAGDCAAGDCAARDANAEIALRKALRELTTNTTRRTVPLRGVRRVRIAAALQLEFDVVKPEVENVLLCTEAR